MSEITYIPGVCNIGPAEINRRRRVGWTNLALTLVAFLVLLLLDVNPLWRLGLAIPAAASASGFLQAYYHFCLGFAMQGVFNFKSIGEISKVVDNVAKYTDKKKALQILAYSIAIGVVVAGVAAVV
jgi:hypothetical protein